MNHFKVTGGGDGLTNPRINEMKALISLHIVSRNRVNKDGLETVDIMTGSGGPENWDMFAEKLTRQNAELILDAVRKLIAKEIANATSPGLLQS